MDLYIVHEKGHFSLEEPFVAHVTKIHLSLITRLTIQKVVLADKAFVLIFLNKAALGAAEAVLVESELNLAVSLQQLELSLVAVTP